MRKPVNILVVDDRDENLLALEAVLSDPSYRIVRARSGRASLLENTWGSEERGGATKERRCETWSSATAP